MKCAAFELALVAALAITACAPRPTTPQSRASAAQQAACRDRADQTILQQNPGTVYQSDLYVSSTRSAPFSGLGIGGNTTAGLPLRYSREQLYDDCLNGLAPAPAPFRSAPPGPSTAPPPPPPS
jgi:hypothetical protein